MIQNNVTVNSTSSGVRQIWVQILALPLPSSVTVDKLLNLRMPQFPHQQIGCWRIKRNTERELHDT